MNIPEYITKDEVRKICQQLKIKDWTKLKESKVSPKEARIILTALKVKGMNINLENFRQGLEVELEHGIRFKDANVTNNHPLLTGKIVLAHFKEALDYYQRLEVAEIEGDIAKTVAAKNTNKFERLYKKLVKAKQLLNKAESKQLKV